MKSVFGKLRSGLTKTKNSIFDKITAAIKASRFIDEALFEELEEILIGGDVGIQVATQLLDEVRMKVRDSGIKESEGVLNFLKVSIKEVLTSDHQGVPFKLTSRPYVIMVVGVNGTGKTTTIGKLAHIFKNQNKKVLLSAADTFRAAASEQLEIWARRSGADIIRNQSGADPSALAYDSFQAAINRNIDILIVDTAGRLHTKTNLMEELKKMKRVLSKIDKKAPHSTLLVMDANTGQNGLSQAREFAESIGVDGIILTKLDGTAKGGIILAIKKELGVPVQFIGTGEQIDDLQSFDPEEFVEALFG